MFSMHCFIIYTVYIDYIFDYMIYVVCILYCVPELVLFAKKHPDPFDDVCRVSYITERNTI